MTQQAEKVVSLARPLSGEARMALWYSLAELDPLGRLETGETFLEAWRRMQTQLERKVPRTQEERHASLRRGMEELLARGIVNAFRDGAGSWVLVGLDGGRLLLSVQPD